MHLAHEKSTDCDFKPVLCKSKYIEAESVVEIIGAICNACNLKA